MSTPIFKVDSFAEEPFSGNPAGVCLLESAPPEDWMQRVAAEMNVAETAFLVPRDDGFDLRWFTPTVEVDLCGHATLASAHCLFEDGEGGPIRFATRSGVLTVSQRADGSLAMDFPAWPAGEVEARSAAVDALGVPVEWTGLTDNGVFLLALISAVGGGLVRDGFFLPQGPPLVLQDERYLYAVSLAVLFCLVFGDHLNRFRLVFLLVERRTRRAPRADANFLCYARDHFARRPVDRVSKCATNGWPRRSCPAGPSRTR
jgi:hypothetical protein